MPDDRTPQTSIIREGYLRLMAELDHVRGRPQPVDVHYDAFDRWLAQHEAELRNQIAAEIDAAADSEPTGHEYYHGMLNAADIAHGNHKETT